MADKPTKKASKKASEKASKKAREKASEKASRKAGRSKADDLLRAQFDREIAAGITDPDSELPPEELNRRLAFLLLMCGHAPLFLATFPTTGRANTKTLEEDGWFKKGELPADVIDALTDH